MCLNNQNSLFQVTRFCTSESKFNGKKKKNRWPVSDYLFSVVLSVKIIIVDCLS